MTIEIINPKFKEEIKKNTTIEDILNNKEEKSISIKIKPSYETLLSINSLLEKGAQQEKKFRIKK